MITQLLDVIVEIYREAVRLCQVSKGQHTGQFGNQHADFLKWIACVGIFVLRHGLVDWVGSELLLHYKYLWNLSVIQSSFASKHY